MGEIYLIGGMALATFAIRYSMFALAGQVKFPAWLVRALQYTPPAVLTAIIVPAVLLPTGDSVQVGPTNPYLVGALVAFGVGWVSKSLLLTILAGMLAFWIWSWLLTGGFS